MWRSASQPYHVCIWASSPTSLTPFTPALPCPTRQFPSRFNLNVCNARESSTIPPASAVSLQPYPYVASTSAACQRRAVKIGAESRRVRRSRATTALTFPDLVEERASRWSFQLRTLGSRLE
ncbi:uncharacterized protein BDZ99DRAFT_119852 [Mytilinidion resinicola]|uniref:Uncharacterized protein n=1 Tax=Mytilinidion resinicola TaxID=574789 RepID=A0A6A6Z3P3_9PEZI|nr:uncharacterized protein BDZ99DRAFT_119852 [Mytilinidion resinicola]KAF2815640.1 hypothetical protein BDZ99DRAFT_119852 [Mytilinidion resinicola]